MPAWPTTICLGSFHGRRDINYDSALKMSGAYFHVIVIIDEIKLRIVFESEFASYLKVRSPKAIQWVGFQPIRFVWHQARVLSQDLGFQILYPRL